MTQEVEINAQTNMVIFKTLQLVLLKTEIILMIYNNSDDSDGLMI